MKSTGDHVVASGIQASLRNKPAMARKGSFLHAFPSKKPYPGHSPLHGSIQGIRQDQARGKEVGHKLKSLMPSQQCWWDPPGPAKEIRYIERQPRLIPAWQAYNQYRLTKRCYLITIVCVMSAWSRGVPPGWWVREVYDGSIR